MKKMKINISILENELEEAKKTQEMLDTFFTSKNQEFSCDTFHHSQDFLSSSITKYDLIILDILLDEGDAYNGIQVAQKVRELNKNVVIIFVTKTAQFAIDGYKVDAIDYILKPLVYEDFYLKLVKAMNVLKYHVEKELVFKNSDGIFKIKESEIVYIEVRKHYLYFQLKNKTETFRGTMKEISQELTNQFKKSSNSFLANLQYIKLIKKDSVILECDNQTYQIPLTKLFRNSFILALENYSGRN